MNANAVRSRYERRMKSPNTSTHIPETQKTVAMPGSLVSSQPVRLTESRMSFNELPSVCFTVSPNDTSRAQLLAHPGW